MGVQYGRERREKTMLETDLEIILACGSDLDRILEIYQIAKEYMRKNGNPNQWNGSYPDRETLQVDIERVANIRVDTHRDNHTMQHLVQKHGFQKCGVIYLKNGSPRLAYHYVEHLNL